MPDLNCFAQYHTLCRVSFEGDVIADSLPVLIRNVVPEASFFAYSDN